MMDGVALRIWNRIVQMRKRGGMPDDQPDELTTEVALTSMDEPWKKMRENMDRHSLAKACWEAYYLDSRISAGVDAIGDHATAADNEGRVFRLSLDLVQDDERNRVIETFNRLEDRQERLKMEGMSPQILKRAFNEGDAYREVILNIPRDTIVDLKEVPGAREGFLMQKLLDKKTDRHVAWGLYDMRFGKVVKAYPPWQIVHFPWNKFMHYGTPLIVSAKTDIIRAAEQESSMHVARQERAYVKYAHIYDGVPSEELEKIRVKAEANKKKRGRGVQTDFYTNKDMKMFDPSNQQLSQLADIEHTEKKIMAAIRYPRGLYGGEGKGINRAVLDKQEQNLIRLLSKSNQMLSEGFRQVLEIQMLLWGVLPDDVPISFTWTDKNAEDFPETVAALAIAVQQIGLDPISALEELGFDSEVVMRRITEWREFEAGLPNNEDEIENRINAEIAKISEENGDEGKEAIESLQESLRLRKESHDLDDELLETLHTYGRNGRGTGRSLRRGKKFPMAMKRKKVAFKF